MKHLVTMVLTAFILWQGSVDLAQTPNDGSGVYRLVYCDDDSLVIEKRVQTTDSLGVTGTTWIEAEHDAWFDEVRPIILEKVIRRLIDHENHMPPIAPSVGVQL